MMKQFKAAVCAAALAIPMAAVPASAQRPVVIGGGLVNVQVGSIDVLTGNIDIIDDVTVGIGVAAQIAANVCGVAVGVLAQDLAKGNDFSCENDLGDAFVNITQ